MTGHFPFAQSTTDPDVARWLTVLMSIEDALHQQGALPDELVFYVAKK